MTAPLDRNGLGLGLHREFVYATPDGRRALVVLSGGGTTPEYRPIRDAAGRVRIGYLNADGSQPDMCEAEYDWINSGDLAVAGVLPNPGDCARCNSHDDDRDADSVCASCREDERLGTEPDEDDCLHENTRPAEAGEPYQRECNDCDARLYLSAEENLRLTARDDGAYYVTSIDGTYTFAGPFLDWHGANTVAEQVEDEHGGAAETDIRFERR